jgi:hypothetical protein
MSGVTQPLPQHISDLVNEMRFVGKCPPKHKICIRDRDYVHKDHWYGSYRRWIANESHIHTYILVEKLANEFAQAALAYSDYPKVRDILLSRALHFRQGIVNLIDTYSDIPDASTRLEGALLIVDLRIPDDVKQRQGILYPSGTITPSPDDYYDDEEVNTS